jgi:2,4-dienoyl-CoA reductase-like NADH-dependent reductase (Old Yellow Enzyme family)
MSYHRVASFKTAAEFRHHLTQSNIALEFDDALQIGPGAPLAQSYRLRNGSIIGNRLCVLPMEGWDGTADGRPSDLTFRRWRRFGASGAKLIWGGEAVAVRPDGRANLNQLMINESTVRDLAALRQALVIAHTEQWSKDDLLIGLQLTHSGRFARPRDKKRLESQILYHHPLLDRKFGLPPDHPLMSDDDIARLVEDYVAAARLAQQAGFAFVDIKHCHGYLGHEFLSAVDRPGRYGGSFENRTRFLCEIVAGIRTSAPALQIGVRFSAFDFVPFRPGADQVGEPEAFEGEAYRYAFGGDGTGIGIDLAEPKQFLDLMASLEIELVCVTAGSPYYDPHVQRPALFPPSDGYQPPEDPLAGVARQIAATAQLKQHRPDLLIVGSAYSYLQEWWPNVAQYMVRTGQADSVGLGRMMLSYPDMCADVLAGRPLQRKRICRTFSDCTTAPRNGLVSGCYPLDDYYKNRPEAQQLEVSKHR